MFLGHLENKVMAILWRRGESSARDVLPLVSRPLAYTTVMTTLDRLFKKGLLKRRKVDRAFLYSAALTQPELLVSSLVDAAGQYDGELLDELEKQIRQKRRELAQQGRP